MKEYLFITPSFSFISKAYGSPEHTIPLPKAIELLKNEDGENKYQNDTVVYLHFRRDGDKYFYYSWSANI